MAILFLIYTIISMFISGIMNFSEKLDSVDLTEKTLKILKKEDLKKDSTQTDSIPTVIVK